jgi:hypothetical protein
VTALSNKLATMSRKSLSADNYDHARFLTLQGEAVTNEARSLIEHLDALLFPKPKGKPKRGRPKNLSARKATLAAILADTLLASKIVKYLWVYRSLDKNNFDDTDVTPQNFTECMKAAVKANLLLHKGGMFARSPVAFGGDGIVSSKASRWKPTDALFELCASYKITPETISKHFRWKLPANPLVLKSPSGRANGQKQRGRTIRFERTAKTEALEETIREINRFLAKHEIAGCTHRSFRRIFNDADDPKSYRWNRGGRLYSDGGDSYQFVNREERSKIKIDGAKTVEIDIKASHLTILYGLAGLKLPKTDPYAVKGLDRDIVKAWFVILFGSAAYPKRWSKETSESYAKRHNGQKPGKKYPMHKVTAICAEKFKAPLKFFFDNKLDSLDLQFIESEIIINAMVTLIANHDRPSLPVHDSLIVKKSDKEAAKTVLEAEFEKRAKIKPILK